MKRTNYGAQTKLANCYETVPNSLAGITACHSTEKLTGGRRQEDDHHMMVAPPPMAHVATPIDGSNGQLNKERNKVGG